MATLTVTHSFTAGTYAKASEVNTNFADILTWANGTIGTDNMATLSGTLTWSITTAVSALVIANASTEHSLSVTQSATMGANKAPFHIINSGAQATTQLASILYGYSSNGASTVPMVELVNSGSGKFIDCKVGASEKFSVSSGGHVVAQSLDVVGRILLAPAGGAILINGTGNAVRVPSGGVEFESGGPILKKSGTNLQLVSGGLEIESGGPVISKSGAFVNANYGFRVGGSNAQLIKHATVNEFQFISGACFIGNSLLFQSSANYNILRMGATAATSKPLVVSDLTTEPLMIVAGTVSSTGTVSPNYSTGMYCTKIGEGAYQVYWACGFAHAPIVHVTMEGGSEASRSVEIAMYSSSVVVRTLVGSFYSDQAFHITIMGPKS